MTDFALPSDTFHNSFPLRSARVHIFCKHRLRDAEWFSTLDFPVAPTRTSSSRRGGTVLQTEPAYLRLQQNLDLPVVDGRRSRKDHWCVYCFRRHGPQCVLYPQQTWRACSAITRHAVITDHLLRVTGYLQREGIVAHLIAQKIEDLSSRLSLLGHPDYEIVGETTPETGITPRLTRVTTARNPSLSAPSSKTD